MSKKTKKIHWDYSGIPRAEWYWDRGKYNDYTAVTTKNGIRYFVDDFWDTHGAGFQTYSEFLEKGGANNMPRDIEDQLTAFILQNRKGGGSYMKGHLEIKSSEITPWRVFFSMDGPSISVITEPSAAKHNPLDLFGGGFPPGKHLLSWAIVFDLIKQKVSKWIVYGKTNINLSPGDHVFRLEAEFTGREDELIVIRAYFNKQESQVFNEDQFSYVG